MTQRRKKNYYKAIINPVGVSFKNPDGSSRQRILERLYDEIYTEGYEDLIKIELRREPENKYDPNAVAFHITAPEGYEGQVGYLNKNQAIWVSEAIKEKKYRSIKLESMGQSKKGKLGLSAEIKVLEKDSKANEIKSKQGRTYEFD